MRGAHAQCDHASPGRCESGAEGQERNAVWRCSQLYQASSPSPLRAARIFASALNIDLALGDGDKKRLAYF
jgi:hypothetical protein